MNSVEKTGKTIDEAVQLALTDLSVSRDRVEVEILEVPSRAFWGFIGGKLAKVRITLKKINPVEVAKNFLNDVFLAMGMTVTIEKLSASEHITLSLRGKDLGVLIGKHGRTLDALQYLANLAVTRDSEERFRIILDVENYRKRREDTLNKLAMRLAEKVKRFGKKIMLEPMSPHERKIIHIALQNDQRIVTYSEGEKPFRKVVIALKR